MTQLRCIFTLLDVPAFGGAEQYLFGHLQYLCDQGYTIVVATNNQHVRDEFSARLSSTQKKKFHLIVAPYRLDAIGNWKGAVKFFLALPSAVWWCWRTLKSLRATYDDVVCLWAGYTDRLVFSPLAKWTGCRLIWIDISALEPLFSRLLGLPKLLYRIGQPFPNHIIVTSAYTAASVQRVTGWPDSKITLVYPGVQTFSPRELAALRHDHPPYCITVARLAHENEVDNVIRAFAAADIDTKIQLVIVGDGPQRSELEALVLQLKLGDRVTFTGFVTEQQKREWLANAQCFIFPRAWELDGFGMTTIEALTVGIPVLTTDFGPQREIVTDGREGFRYRPHDATDLAKKIEQILKLPLSEKNRLRRHALQRAEAFDLGRGQEKLRDVILRQ